MIKHFYITDRGFELFKKRIAKIWANYSIFNVFIDAHRPYWGKQIAVAVLLSLCTIPYALSPWAVKFFFDSAISEKSWSSMILAICLFSLIQLFSILTPGFETTFFGILGLRAMRKTQKIGFSNFIKMSPEEKKSFSPGNLTQRLVGDASSVSKYGGRVLISPLTGIIQIIAALPTAFLLCKELSFVLFPLLLLQLHLQRMFRRQSATINSIHYHAISNINTMLYEHSANSGIYLSSKSQNQCNNKFQGMVDAVSKISAKSVARMFFANSVSQVIISVKNLCIWVLGGYLCITDQMTLGELIAFQTVVPMLSGNFNKIVSPILELRGSRPSAERLFEFITPQNNGLEGVVEKNTFCDALELQNISFCYSPLKPIFNNISFTIKPGECVRILGGNGCGKSTLLNIITGALVPDSGQVLVDEKSITDLTIQSRSDLFSYAPQDICFFSGTLRYNMELFCEIDSKNFEDISAIL